MYPTSLFVPAPSAILRSSGCAAGLLIAAALAAQLASSQAHAQYGARASVERPVAARNEEDATAAGLQIDLRDRPVALESVGDVMREVPGANPLVGGNYGAFSSVSLRGSQLGHTVWVLGEVPLNTPDSGAFDMSTLPLPTLSSLEVYRGGAPAWYSQGAIGGVIRVVPAEAQGSRVSATAGGGSFGRYDLRANGQVVEPNVELYTGVNLTHADNDFPYLDTGLDYDDGADDQVRRVRNGEITDGSGLLHLKADAGPGQLDMVMLGLERAGGLPGPGGSYNTKLTHRNYIRGLGSLAYTQERYRGDHRVYRLQLLGSGRVEYNRVQDPLSEFGLGGRGADRRTLWRRGTLRAAGSYSPLSWVETTLIGTFATDHVDTKAVAQPKPPVSVRNTEAVTAELRFMGRLRKARAELRGSARLEWSQAEVRAETAGQPTTLDDDVLSPTYRVAALVEPVAGLTVRASWATGQRLPSVLEMFGDGGFLRGNARLEPEKGTSADLGVVLAGRAAKLAGTLEVNGFVQKLEDVIIWRNTNQNEYVAINEDSAFIPGVEIGLNGCISPYFSITGAATLLNAENTATDTQLPRRPKARAFVRPEVSFFFDAPIPERLAFFGSVDYQSTFFHDRANERLQEQRTLIGAGTALYGFDQRIGVRVRVQNLLDVRTQDFFRFPLPGRSFVAMVTYQEEI